MSVVGMVFKSNNCGDMTVIRRGSYRDIDVMFNDTGTIVNVKNISHVYNGRVKDPMIPLVCGVGYHGIGNYKAFLGGRKRSKAYSRWHGMLSRCYNKKESNYPRYGGKGVTVSELWHNFQNFADWYFAECDRLDLDPESNNYHVDKDICGEGRNIYSPEFCMLVTPTENSVHAKAMSWKVTSPDGVVIDIYNLSKYCRDNGLSQPSMRLVCLGLQGEHRGYTPPL